MDFNDKQQFLEHGELLERHIEKHFNNAEISVFHEIPTLDIHLDIYHIKPKDSEFDLLLTSGMSSMSMNVSEISNGSDSYRFAELMVLIPKGVDFGKMYPSGTKYDWIISMIKQTAKFPHFYDTWIGVGHTLQANENLSPYSEDTSFCGCLLLPTITFPDGFKKIASPNGEINIYSLFPLYKDEIEFKIKKGFNEFVQYLIKNDAKEVVDFNRLNYCKA